VIPQAPGDEEEDKPAPGTQTPGRLAKKISDEAHRAGCASKQSTPWADRIVPQLPGLVKGLQRGFTKRSDYFLYADRQAGVA
jgi:hypothetical protein